MTRAAAARRSRTARGLIAIAAVGAMAAGCTSSGGGAEPTRSARHSTPSSPSASTRPPLPTAIPDLPAKPPATAAALAVLMQHGLAATNSAHLTFATQVGADAVTGTGEQVSVSGRVTGLKVSTRIPSVGTVGLLLVNSIAYAQLPTPTKTGTHYTVVSATSSHESVRTVAKVLAATELAVAPGTYETLVKAATTLAARGSGTIGGTPALHYQVTSSVARIPAADPLHKALNAAGLTSVDLDLWVDGNGRPVRVTTKLGSGPATTTVTFTALNRPLALSAPAVKDVDTGS